MKFEQNWLSGSVSHETLMQNVNICTDAWTDVWTEEWTGGRTER